VLNNFCCLYEVIWKKIVEMTVWRTCIARRIPEATPTHLDYVIFIA